MSFFLFLLIVILFILNSSLTSRVNTLERKLKQNESPQPGGAPSEIPSADVHEASEALTPIPQASGVEDTSVWPAPSVSRRQSIHHDSSTSEISRGITAERGDSKALSWFKDQTLIKIGSIIFFLGAVWFVSYAIEQNWISPLLRIVLGVLLGIAGYILAYTRKVHDQLQYQVISVLGTAIILGTVVASQFAFAAPVLPAWLAFSSMVLALAYTVRIALETKTEWINVVSAIAGYVLPFLVVTETPSLHGLLLYGALLAVCLLTVAFSTAWRSTTIISLIGSIIYLLLAVEAGTLTDMVMWWYVILYSLVFVGVTTLSVWRTRQPLVLDVSVLGIIGLQYISYAIALTTEPALMVFLAATLVALIGYGMHHSSANANGVVLYSSLSAIGILVATTLQFDGFVLTVAYAFEVLMVFALALRFGKTDTSYGIAAVLFTLPVLSGIGNLLTLSESATGLRAETTGVLSVIVAMAAASYVALKRPRESGQTNLVQIATALLAVLYVFFISSVYVIATIYDGIFLTEATLLIVSALLAVCIVLRVGMLTQTKEIHYLALLSLFVPTLVSVGTLIGQQTIVSSTDLLFAALLYGVSLFVLGAKYWMDATANTLRAFYGRIAYGLLWVKIVFVGLFFTELWSMLPMSINEALRALTWLIVLYVSAHILLLLKQPKERVYPVLYSFVVPIILSISFYEFNGWPGGILSIDAVALYVFTTICMLLGKTLYDHSSSLGDAYKAFVVIAGLQSFALVWMISQSLFVFEAMAVTVALIIYTVAGLYAYVYGRINERALWQRAGIYILIAVVLRLFLIDFWVMEQVWQIITFLGVGGLFIAAALYESTRRKQEQSEDGTELE